VNHLLLLYIYINSVYAGGYKPESGGVVNMFVVFIRDVRVAGAGFPRLFLFKHLP